MSNDYLERSVKLLNTYNYVFNQLILQEKQRDSERAVLLRRLQQFFVDQASLQIATYSDQKVIDCHWDGEFSFDILSM